MSMHTPPPPAWAWVEEKYVPIKYPASALSVSSRKLPASATLRKRNDSEAEPEVSSSTTRKLEPDPTGSDIWPLERECDCTAQATDSHNNAAPSQRIGTCYLDPDNVSCDHHVSCDRKHDNLDDGRPAATVKAAGCAADKLCGVHPRCPVCRHEMESDEGVLCDHCEETIGVESFTVVNGPGGVFVYHLPCYDEVYWGGRVEGQESGTSPQEPLQTLVKTADIVLDTLDQTLGTPTVPFSVQEFMFEELAPVQAEYIHDILNDHMDLIIEMARDRFRKGYAKYGSAMYSWSPERRLDETLQELADAVVYLTSGNISC